MSGTLAPNYEQYLSDLRAQMESHLKEAKRLEEQIERGQAFAREYQEWESANQHPEPDDHQAGKHHDHVPPKDISDAPTMRAAAEIIARMSDDLLYYREAAGIMVAAGKTTSDVGSAASTLYKMLNGRDEWEWADAGVFRYLHSKERTEHPEQEMPEDGSDPK